MGYNESKWVAESLVRRAAERGIDVSIYRPGIIVGDSRTGACAPDDLFNSMLRGCIEIGSAPDLDVPFDMTPVDYVARALVHLSTARRQDRIASYHLVNPSRTSVPELCMMIKACGHSLRVEPYDDWYARILRAGSQMEFPLRRYLTVLPTSGNHPSVLRLPVYDCTQTVSALQGSGVEFPPITSRFVAMTLRYQRQLGLVRQAAQASHASSLICEESRV